VARIKALGLAALTELEDAVTPTVDPDPELHNRHRLCPACHVSMDKFRYMYSSNIILDECPNCGGVWVQDGELRRMREVLESQTTGPKVVRVSSATAVKPNAESFSLRLQRVHQFILGIGKS
jgi:Zn-finger nucleic acid-binding protein